MKKIATTLVAGLLTLGLVAPSFAAPTPAHLQRQYDREARKAHKPAPKKPAPKAQKRQHKKPVPKVQKQAHKHAPRPAR